MTFDESAVLGRSDHIKDGEPLIQIRGVKKWFPVNTGFLSSLLYKQELYVKAVDGVTFDVFKGEVLVLAGGRGEGLWPLSRKDFPKQFMEINGKSFFRKTIEISLVRSN